MRPFLVFFLLACAALAQASSTLRVGSRVLTAGDSAERVIELLGKPSSKTRVPRTPRASTRGGVRVIDPHQGGVRWRYRRGGHVTVVTIVDDRVVEIEDRRL